MVLPGYTKSEEASEYLVRAAFRELNNSNTRQAHNLFNASGAYLNEDAAHEFYVRYVQHMHVRFEQKDVPMSSFANRCTWPKELTRTEASQYSFLDLFDAINKKDYEKAAELAKDVPVFGLTHITCFSKK